MERLRTTNDRILAMGFLAAVGVVAMVVAWSGTAPGDLHFVPCLFHALTGIPCPGCGITRAFVALFHGDFAQAWAHHPFVYLLAALAIGTALGPSSLRRAWQSVPGPARSGLLLLGVTLCLTRWALIL